MGLTKSLQDVDAHIKEKVTDNPHGVYDVHLKEMFPYVTFVDLEGRTVGDIVLSRVNVTLANITLD